jgi:hypothetical protein
MLVGNEEAQPQGSDTQGLLEGLLEAARRRNLSANSLAAYERTWTRFLAWAAAASFDPRSLPFPTALETYWFLGEGKNAASLKQIRAALSFAYKHWDLKNPFAKIEPPLHKEPQIRYLLLADIRRLLDYLKARQQGYGSALAFHLAKRYRNGELISSGFVESTVNQVVSKRMVKKQQMQMDAARSPSTVAGKSVVKFTHWALFAQEKS